MQLHLSQIQLGPHQTNNGAQRQEAHPTRPQSKRSENDSGQRGSHEHHGKPRQPSESRATQAASDLAFAQVASAEITRRS